MTFEHFHPILLCRTGEQLPKNTLGSGTMSSYPGLPSPCSHSSQGSLYGNYSVFLVFHGLGIWEEYWSVIFFFQYVYFRPFGCNQLLKFFTSGNCGLHTHSLSSPQTLHCVIVMFVLSLSLSVSLSLAVSLIFLSIVVTLLNAVTSPRQETISGLGTQFN